MTLDPKEIDKERGVVIEEWRLRQGAGVAHPREAGAGALLQVALRASASRSARPKSFARSPAARLRDFYETWYRPERMAVVVIGDIDPAVLEKSIASTFGSLADKRPPAPDPDRSVPEHAETLVNVTADPEGQATAVSLLRKTPVLPQNRVADYRRDLVRAADVPAAEHPVRRAGAEAGRAVARAPAPARATSPNPPWPSRLAHASRTARSKRA